MLTSFPPSLSAQAERSLSARCHRPPGAPWSAIDAGGVTIEAPGRSRSASPARTVIWAAGVNASSLAGRLAELTGAELDRAGRITVEPDLTLPGTPR